MNIVLLIPGHLCSGPRTQKEASALVKAGHNVTIVCSWSVPTKEQEDLELSKIIGAKLVPVSIASRKSFANIYAEICHKIAKWSFLKFGFISCRTFGRAFQRQKQIVSKLRPDLLIAHSESGMQIARELHEEESIYFAVDFEDWYSEMETTVPAMKTELAKLEDWVLEHAIYCSTTSHCLAIELERKVLRPCKILVVYNTFPISVETRIRQIEPDKRTSFCSFYWYSQVIGPHRGLETLAEALEGLKGEWQLTIRGQLTHYETWYKKTFCPSLTRRINVVEPVSNLDLFFKNRGHDVGLAIETPISKNKQLTVSNKFFDYMRSGLAIIATDTEGQREIASRVLGGVKLINSDNAQQLRDAMQYYIDNTQELAEAKSSSLESAHKQFCWEISEQKLLQDLETITTFSK